MDAFVSGLVGQIEVLGDFVPRTVVKVSHLVLVLDVCCIHQVLLFISSTQAVLDGIKILAKLVETLKEGRYIVGRPLQYSKIKSKT